MVRKWSYLNTNQVHDYLSLHQATKTKTFKVFRKTTKFKKFTKGLTKIVRQKYTKRKFNSMYFVLPQITKWWSFNYMQSKQVERFTQSFYHVSVAANMPNFDVFLAAIKPTDQSLNMHMFSCTKRLAYRVDNSFYQNKTFLVETAIKNAKLSFTQTTSFESLIENEISYPLNSSFEQLSYHPQSLITDQEKLQVYKSLVSTLFAHNLNYTVSIYRTLISLTLLSNTKY